MGLSKSMNYLLALSCFAILVRTSHVDIVELEHSGDNTLNFESPYTKRLKVLDSYRTSHGREPDVSGVYSTPNLKPAEARLLWENIAKVQGESTVYPEVLTPRVPLSSQYKDKIEGGVKLSSKTAAGTQMKTLRPLETTTTKMSGITLEEEFDSVISPITSTSTVGACVSNSEEHFSDLSDSQFSGGNFDSKRDVNNESLSESDFSDRGEHNLSVDFKGSQKEDSISDVSWNYSYPLVPYDIDSLVRWVDSEISRLVALRDYVSENLLEVLESMWNDSSDGDFHRDPMHHLISFIDDSLSLTNEFRTSCNGELTSIKEMRGAAYGIAERVDIAVEISTLYASKISAREEDNVRKFSRDYMKEPIIFYDGVFSIGFGTPNEDSFSVLESAKLVIRDPNASHEDVQSAIDTLRIREMLLESMGQRRSLISKLALSQMNSMVNVEDSVIQGIIQTNSKYPKRLGCEKTKCRDPKKSKFHRSECKDGECVKTECNPDCHRVKYTTTPFACTRHEASCKDPECIGTHCVRGKCAKGNFRKGHCVKGEFNKGECQSGKCKKNKFDNGELVTENCQLPRRVGAKCVPPHVEDNKCQAAHCEGDSCTPAHVKGSECKEVRYCENPHCVKGECERGECVSGKCKSGKWKSGHFEAGHCVKGEFKKPVCAKGECQRPKCEGGYCNRTECEDGTCQGPSCKAHKCVDGKCKPARCQDGKCKPAHREGVECQPGHLEGGVCQPAHCEGGKCVSAHADWENKKKCEKGNCKKMRSKSKGKTATTTLEPASPFVNPLLNSYLAEEQ